MYKDLTVPENNSLKKEIKEMLSWLDKKEADNELGRTTFAPACTEEKMAAWESANGIKIPESYKEWLRFTEECTIDGTTAQFFGPDHFRTDYVPENLIVIGEVVGDGEQVCFDKETGEIVTWFERKKNHTSNSFIDMLKRVNSLIEIPEKVEMSTIELISNLERICQSIRDDLEKQPENERYRKLLNRTENEIKKLKGM